MIGAFFKTLGFSIILVIAAAAAVFIFAMARVLHKKSRGRRSGKNDRVKMGEQVAAVLTRKNGKKEHIR